jgi:hypothetical protein
MVSNSEIEEVLHRVSSSAIETGKLGRPDWKAALLSSLTALAYSKNLWVACNPTDEDPTTAEWLWDFVIYESSDPTGKRIGRIHLALESEYDSRPDKIREDLHKVIVARTGMRAFVFWAGDIAHRESVFSFIQNEISESPNSEETDLYLVAGWSCESGTFEFKYMKKLSLTRQ